MPRNPNSTLRTAVRLTGAAALLASGGVHLDLYITGYHAIPTIGPLFLVQTISALALGLVLSIRSDEILSAGGALLAIGTLGGYVVSRAVGMFGFHEVATTAGLSAGLLDTLAFCALGFFATSRALPLLTPAEAQARTTRDQLRLRVETLTTTGTAHVALLVLGLAALVLTLVDGLGASTSSPTPTTTAASTSPAAGGAASVTITINNFAFSPAHVTVTPGERIVVHNEDPVAHTLTAIPGSTPLGKFNTGNVGSGQTKSVTAPGTAGTYQYYCAIHNFMTGSITVKT
jgi:plastocyanin